ncbi:unnamed protein product [Chilo suppressalis]|uniref:THAP-type domain-containing protein n=1 Tax=Chilo suppressalis TaxID=168631 RepID=A0ABN8EAX7_CHISP|nr:unnamed protein product [Chilo suppressalis]
MERRKRVCNILEQALECSGINVNQQLLASKTSRKANSKNRKRVEYLVKSRALESKENSYNKSKLKVCNKILSNCTSIVPTASRRITEDAENYNPEEVFDHTEFDSYDGAGFSTIYFDPLQKKEIAPPNLPLIADVAIDPDSLHESDPLNFSMDKTTPDPDPSQNEQTTPPYLPSIDVAAAELGPSQNEETTPTYLLLIDDVAAKPALSQNEETAPPHLPTIDNATSDLEHSQSEETAPPNPPPMDDATTDLDPFQNNESAPTNSPSTDDVVPEPDPSQNEGTTPPYLPSVDDAIIDLDPSQYDETIPPYIPSIDDAAADDPQHDKISRRKNLPRIDGAIPGGSRRKRKAKTSSRYVDYMSDEDFSTVFGSTVTDSDEWAGSEVSDSSEEQNQTKKKKPQKNKKNKRKLLSKNESDEKDNITKENMNADDENVGERGLKRKKKNTRKERSALKQSGKTYTRTDGKIVQEKTIQPNPCKGKKCGNNCENVTEEKRQQVFNHFWTLPSERRRDWLVGMTNREPVKRKRVDSEKRSNTFRYCITEGEGKRVVCLQFLAATLDISQKCIYYTVRNANCGTSRDDLRGKCIPPNKTKPSTKETVVNFIKSLPAVPSHYCRQDSNRVYLPQEYKNRFQLIQQL